MSDNKTIDILKDFFISKADVSMAFLFGSAASGKTRDDSDVDIAVYFEEDFKVETINAMWIELEKLLGCDVDLVILNKDNSTLAWSALRGIPLLVRDYSFYLEYMLQISREAEDFQDFIIDLWKMRTDLRGEVH
jgi:predicted nucleotidyltransferase